MKPLSLAAVVLVLAGCAAAPPPVVPVPPPAAGEAAAGVLRIPIETSRGTFHVWTRTAGDNPSARVLLLHGGPGATHDYMKVFERFLPPAGIEIILYDQLGSFHSDQPDAPELWEIDRFVDEVEQVRRALDLGPENFYLLGHSWGGILAIEYAFAHPRRLEGLIVSNMMASIPAYNEYARTVLMPAMDQAVLAEIQAFEAAGDTTNPRYMELLMEHHYVHHVLRRPADEWPEDAVLGFDRINPAIYVPMQGPSELGASGKIAHWDRTSDLHRIPVPTLVIGAAHDTMDPRHMEWMANELPQGRHLALPDGSHMAMYDDQERYLGGLIDFIHDVDGERFEG